MATDFTNLTLSSRTNAGRKYHLSGTFMTNGASDPVVVSGDILSVRRLVDGAARPFFRVKLSDAFLLEADDTVVSTGVLATSGEPVVTALSAVLGDCTPNPATTKGDDEFDVAILSGGVASDAAGNRFSFQSIRVR